MLLVRAEVERVTVYDNFTSGRRWHLEAGVGDPRLEIVEGEVDDIDRLTAAMSGATPSSTSRPTPTSPRP